jgi:hypothetical protein
MKSDTKTVPEFTMPTGFYHDDELGQDSSTLMSKSPRSLYEEYLLHTSQGVSRKELPKFSSHEALYTSTATLLKRTKDEVSEFAKDLGALDVVTKLSVSSDVMRTVAKIFADPKNAEAISDAEWKRREQEYIVNREVFFEKMSEHMRKERESLQRELQQLPK